MFVFTIRDTLNILSISLIRALIGAIEILKNLYRKLWKPRATRVREITKIELSKNSSLQTNLLVKQVFSALQELPFLGSF